MAKCGTCGGGGGKKDLQVLRQSQSQFSSKQTANSSAEWVLFEYIGQPIQIRQVQSHKNRARKYRYGGRPGEMQRRILVHPDDVEMFAGRQQDFKLADIQKDLEASAPVRAQVIEPPMLRVDRGFLSEPELPIDLLQNYGLAKAVVTILKEGQYTTIERLRFASDAELLSIKNISDTRVKRIKESLSAFLKAA